MCAQQGDRDPLLGKHPEVDDLRGCQPPDADQASPVGDLAARWVGDQITPSDDGIRDWRKPASSMDSGRPTSVYVNPVPTLPRGQGVEQQRTLEQRLASDHLDTIEVWRVAWYGSL